MNSSVRIPPLSRQRVDRDAQSREAADAIDRLRASSATRVLTLHEGRALLEGPQRVRLLPPAEVPEAELWIYLGLSTVDGGDAPAGTPLLAAVLDEAGAAALEGEWSDLRTVGGLLDDRDAGIFTEALAMANWHRTHIYSPRSGDLTVPGKAGWVRLDPVDGSELYPRTDPAVIMAVLDGDDRILLGSNAMWAGNRYSLLAGFVEPGESLEAAVVREVWEEAGLRVVEPRYWGSQPWPFPASVMIGFTARLDSDSSGAATPDGTEILDLRWFSRDELTAALADVVLPGRTSIARAIIEDWYGGPLGDGA